MNTIDFKNWLCAFFKTTATAEKYVAIVESISRDNTPLNIPLADVAAVENILQTEYGTEKTNKDFKKALMYVRAYWVLSGDSAQLTLEEAQKEHHFNLADFYSIAQDIFDQSSTTAKKMAENIQKMEEETGLLEVQSIASAATIINRKLTEVERYGDEQRALLCYAAYCFSSTLKKETEADDNGSNTGTEGGYNDYKIWSLNAGNRLATVQTQITFIQKLSDFAASYGYTSFAEGTAEENLAAVIHVYTDNYALEYLLNTQASRKYTDTYGQYLIECMAARQQNISPLELPYKPTHPAHRPVLIMGDAKEVAAKYRKWLIENKNLPEQSTRTYVFQLNSANAISQKELGIDLYNVKDLREVIYARICILAESETRRLLGSPLMYYINFLSQFELVDTEAYQRDTADLLTLIAEQFNGKWDPSSKEDIPKIYNAWRIKYKTNLLYNEEQLQEAFSQLMVQESEGSVLILADKVITEEIAPIVFNYIEAGFQHGSPAVSYDKILEQIQREAPAYKNKITESLLINCLKGQQGTLFRCEKRHVVPASQPEKIDADYIADYICDILKKEGAPISEEELQAKLPYLSNTCLEITLARYGWKKGIINPRKEKLFHADIVKISEVNLVRIAIKIHDILKEKDYLSSGTLFEMLTQDTPEQENSAIISLAEHPYLSIFSVFAILRYKLSDIFNFHKSFIGNENTITTPEIFVDFCRERESFDMDDLLQLEEELKKTSMPLDRIYEVCTRINDTNFVRRDLINFDTESIDNAIAEMGTEPLLLMSDLLQVENLPQVDGYPWTDHLMLHYLHFHSKKFKILFLRFTKKSRANGFIIPREDTETTFEKLTAKHLASLEEIPEAPLNYLYDRGLIGVRRYENLQNLLDEVEKLRNGTSA